MSARRKIEKGIAGLIIIGLIVFAYGLMSWIYNIASELMPFEAILAVLGLVVVLIAILVAKIFSEIKLWEE